MMDSEDIYENIQCGDFQDSTGPQTHNHNQDEEKDREHGRCRCVMVLLVFVGFICALLLLFITLQHISITAERELLKTYKNTVEELNHTISSLQHDNTDLKTDKHQLEEKYNSMSLEKHQLETKYNSLSLEKHQLETKYNSLSLKKQQLETSVDDLSAQKSQLQNNSNSLSQKKLELENRVTSLSDELKKAYSQYVFLLMSTEEKSWSDSRQFCRNHGGDLVIIKSEEKQRFISSVVKDDSWIGLSDTQTEGTMKWVDYSPLNQGFWASGEPNNAGVNEDCVELTPTRPVLNNWNDEPCSRGKKGICEK
ncbi:uncharacterized protein [Danio rerio]|uniref:C-type lectin domain-containing protein n=1 Tax=Danio rerio TaxID=7955 RepID=A0A8M1RES2_DANRE|nr:CD209 antigen [Danio rerio]|eukprot:XP_003197805.3 CD209 antigen [Danio rerio]